MRAEGILEVAEHTMALQPPRLHPHQHALDEAVAGRPPTAQAPLAPQHGPAVCARGPTMRKTTQENTFRAKGTVLGRDAL